MREQHWPSTMERWASTCCDLPTHFDFPAAHWKYIPSTKPIEFTFAR
jgi:transposase-like protein